MKQIFVLILVLLVMGCTPQSRRKAVAAKRRAYITENLAEIEECNRALLVRKSENLLTWRPSIESIAERKEELMDVIIRAMCGEDPDMLARELLTLAPISEIGGEAVAELKAGLQALSWAADPNMCTIFERAIARGNIAEGMTVEQVEAAWGRKLLLLSADSMWAKVYRARAVEQENYILTQGKIVIASTTQSMGGHWSDFYLEFKEGRLADWMFVPHNED
ncbi:MAG: hypothetical protein ACYS8Z_16830 [Planctomycetota bacterium]|jgi:hypothetical protein